MSVLRQECLCCDIVPGSEVRPRFFIIVLCTRPWGLLFASALGAVVLEMPLWTMALMGAAGLVIFLVGIRYAEGAERWLTNIILR